MRFWKCVFSRFKPFFRFWKNHNFFSAGHQQLKFYRNAYLIGINHCAKCQIFLNLTGCVVPLLAVYSKYIIQQKRLFFASKFIWIAKVSFWKKYQKCYIFSREIEMTTRRYGMLISAYLLVQILYSTAVGLATYPRGDSQFLSDDSIIQGLGLLDLLDSTNATKIVVVVAGRGVRVCLAKNIVFIAINKKLW